LSLYEDVAIRDSAELGYPGDDDPPGPRHPRLRRALWWSFTVLAALVVFAALVVPNRLERLTPGNFVVLPLEGLVGVAVILVLPGRLRTWFAVLFGVALGVLTLQKFFDMGFYSVLARPFDPVLDGVLAGPGIDYLETNIGRGKTIAAVAGMVLLAVAVVVVITWATLRVARAAVRYRRPSTALVAVVAVAWTVCAVLDVQYVPKRPVANYATASIAYDRGAQGVDDVRDRGEFARESSVDAFRDTPGDKMLTGLRGKDVLLTFVESYGRSSVEDPAMASDVDATLATGSQRLRAAGYASRSGWLTSSTVGGGSWLAHSTLLSGLWINTAQRYRTLTSSDRLTLNGAFKRAGWRTAAVMPEIRRAWPEGKFYGYDAVHGRDDLAYQGPTFGYATMPDQYTMSALQNLERSEPGHKPVMVETALVSSHIPWSPLPSAVPWDQVGNGSVFKSQVTKGGPKRVVWKEQDQAQAAYSKAIQYSVTNLVSYVETYGDDNLVMVFLGDHQPAPLVTGPDASRDVPITIVAKDPKVLDRISGWGWTDGLHPAAQAPVWKMDSFRDRFLTAFAR
jgi:hypothetical protein